MLITFKLNISTSQIVPLLKARFELDRAFLKFDIGQASQKEKKYKT